MSMPIAQVRHEGSGLWTLFVADGNGKWARYSELDPSQSIDVVIAELDDDPTGIFCG